jgi:glycosyltransferase 2 family protein
MSLWGSPWLDEKALHYTEFFPEVSIFEGIYQNSDGFVSIINDSSLAPSHRCERYYKNLMSRKNFPLFLLQIAVSVALFAFLVLQIDPGAFIRSILKIKIGYLLIALVLFPLGQLVSVIKWRYLARPLGIHQDFKPMAGLYFIGTFFNFLLPTSIGGDITRSLYLSPEAGKTRIAFLSVLVERGSGVVSHLILASIVLLTPIGAPLPKMLRFGFPALSLLVLVFFALLPCILRRTRTKLRDVVCQDLIVFWRNPRIGIVAVLYSMLFHTVLVLIHISVTRALSLSIPVPFHFITVSLASLAALLPSMNGIGIRDAVYIYLLSFLGISPAQGLLFSICWLITMAVSGFIGCIVYLMRGLNRPSPMMREVRHGER